MCFRTVAKAEVQSLPPLEEYRWTLGAGQLHGDRALILHINPSGNSVTKPMLTLCALGLPCEAKDLIPEIWCRCGLGEACGGSGLFGFCAHGGLVGCEDLAML